MNGREPNPQLILVLLPVVWCVVSVLLAHIGGWRELARAYPATRRFDGEKLGVRSARLGYVNYNNCIRVSAGPAGLLLRMILPFRLAHPPILVPWTEVSVSDSGKRGWLIPPVTLTTRRCPWVTIRTDRRLAGKLAQAAGAAWPASSSRVA